jgi:orotate phosphoribosyltransferase
MLVAESMDLPLYMYDQKQKKHGRQNQVKVFTKGQNVVVVEDLISTGTSSLNVVEAFTRLEQILLNGCIFYLWF